MPYKICHQYVSNKTRYLNVYFGDCQDRSKISWEHINQLFWAQGGGNTSVASPFVPKKSLKSLKNQSLKNGSSYLKSFFTMKTFETSVDN